MRRSPCAPGAARRCRLPGSARTAPGTDRSGSPSSPRCRCESATRAAPRPGAGTSGESRCSTRCRRRWPGGEPPRRAQQRSCCRDRRHRRTSSCGGRAPRAIWPDRPPCTACRRLRRTRGDWWSALAGPNSCGPTWSTGAGRIRPTPPHRGRRRPCSWVPRGRTGAAVVREPLRSAEESWVSASPTLDLAAPRPGRAALRPGENPFAAPEAGRLRELGLDNAARRRGRDGQLLRLSEESCCSPGRTTAPSSC